MLTYGNDSAYNNDVQKNVQSWVVKNLEKYDYDFSKLKGRIVEEHFTISSLAQAAGISRSSMYNKLSNGSNVGFSQNEIAEISKLLHIDLDNISEYFFAPNVQKSVHNYSS